MNSASRLSTPLQSIFWHANNSFAKQSTIMLLGVLVLAFASQLSIPFVPVPLTFQSATVILIGMTFGSKRGAAVVAAYLFAGACGLPVFADFSAGFARFMGPTGGYLIGFLPAAYISGFLAERGFVKSFATSILAAFIGVSVIFILGVSVLSSFVGWHNAFLYGLLPFIISEPIKLLAAACVAPTCWK
jgi:biotin transport system substrate-specific component